MQKLDVLLLYGSQSGTSESLAHSFARLCQVRLGLQVEAAGLDQYDPKSLAGLSKDKVIGFIVSTFGEGDPPDNAVEFATYLAGAKSTQRLTNLKFFAFGLGSSKYQFYNRFVDDVDQSLIAAGASRIGSVGKLDEAQKSDASWNEWKDATIQQLAESFHRQVVIAGVVDVEAEFDIVDLSYAATPLGTASHALEYAQLLGGRVTHFTAPIAHSKVLSSGQKVYLHLEFDMKGADRLITYEVGDHLAFWPSNFNTEIERMGRMFAWDETRLKAPITLRARTESRSQISGPKRTTRDSILRHQLDICGPVSKLTMRLLSRFAPSEKAREFVDRLVKNKETWRALVVAQHLTCGKVMELAVKQSTEKTWPETLFILLIQTLPKLRPRYFSIASSPLQAARRVGITVAVLKTALQGVQGDTFHGLATDHLHSMHSIASGRAASDGTCNYQPRRFALMGRGDALLHIRSSKFRPPMRHETPMIMVAAGSGIAPFRAFVQQRHALSDDGAQIGESLLFFGCRSASEDLLYKNEWDSIADRGWFELDVAESRAVDAKVYVQDRVRARQEEVLRLMRHEGASLYICGSTKMANAVRGVITEMLVETVNSVDEVQKCLEEWRVSKRLQEDVWS